MTIADLFQFLLYATTVIVLVKPLGWYITKVFNGESFFLRRPVEKMEFLLCNCAAGVKVAVEQHLDPLCGQFFIIPFYWVFLPLYGAAFASYPLILLTCQMSPLIYP